MSRDGMQAHAQDGSSNEVNNGFQPPEIEDNCVCCKLNYSILDLQLTDWFRIDNQWSQGIE